MWTTRRQAKKSSILNAESLEDRCVPSAALPLGIDLSGDDLLSDPIFAASNSGISDRSIGKALAALQSGNLGFAGNAAAPQTSSDTATVVTPQPGNAARGSSGPLSTTLVSTGSNTIVVSATQSLQAAVNAASPGDTLLLAPGTWAEQIHITKNLTIIGSSQGPSIISTPSTALVADAYGVTALVEVGNGAVVSMSHLTITGPGPAPGGPPSFNAINYGIFVVENASLDLGFSNVVQISDDPLSGVQSGVGIRVGSNALGQVGTANIHDDTIASCQKSAIVIDGPGSSAMITNDHVIGVGDTPLIAENGVQVSRGATATITGNTITGSEYSGPVGGPDPRTATQSCGILLYNAAAGTTVSGNVVYGNDIGLYATTLGPVTVTGNFFGQTATGAPLAANRYEGLFLGQGTVNASNDHILGGNIGVFIYNFTGTTAAAQATLTNETITGTVQKGIWMSEDAGVGFHPSLIIHNSTISMNQALGIDVAAGHLLMQNSNLENNAGIGALVEGTGTADFGNLSGTGVAGQNFSVGYNNIVGNQSSPTGIGIQNTTSTLVKAQANWWGSPGGPGTPGSNIIVGNVDASSPLAAPVLAGGLFFLDGNHQLWLEVNGKFTNTGGFATRIAGGIDAQSHPECYFTDGNNQVWRWDNGVFKNLGVFATRLAAGQGMLAFTDGANMVWLFADATGKAIATTGTATRLTGGFNAFGQSQFVFTDASNQVWLVSQTGVVTNTGAFGTRITEGTDAEGNFQVWFTDGNNEIWRIDNGSAFATGGFALSMSGGANGVFFQDGINEIFFLSTGGKGLNTGAFGTVISSSGNLNAVFLLDGNNRIFFNVNGQGYDVGAFALPGFISAF
jgi:hypothetical protein